MIEANLGGLGRIDLRFDAQSTETEPRGSKECRGKPSVYELGTFRGMVRFRGENGYTQFSARRVEGAISHSYRERRGRITIERSGLVSTDENALRLGPADETPTATLTLPPPFSGSGTFVAGGNGAPTWSGSLRVDLPGATVALTGPGFASALCSGSTLEAVSDCMRPVSAEAARGPR